jgi:S1-C subfamily serine protease
VRRAAALCALLAIAGCGGGGGSNTSSQPTKVVSQTQTTTVEVLRSAGAKAGAANGFDPQTIYKAEGPGVVTLIALDSNGKVSGNSSAALGSGFVVDPAGYIVTNAHVVTNDSGQRAKQVYVEFADGNRVTGRIVGTDFDSDVAVIKVDPTQLRGEAHIVALPWGSTAEVQVGDPVAAIGSPFGEEQSLSVGVISALDRDIQSLTNFDISNAVQTDAAINHGNSGGPLLDATGKVIGMNAQIQSSSGGGEGVGFAIPVETVKHSVDQLRRKGHVDYAYLGISSVPLYPQLAQRLGVGALRGALIDQVVKGGPADHAGLHGAESHIDFQDDTNVPVGSDVIVGVAGHKLARAEDLSGFIGQYNPGQPVKLEIVRGQKHMTVTVTLGKRPEKLARSGG